MAALQRTHCTGHDRLKAVRPKLSGGLGPAVDEHLALSARMIEGLGRVEAVLHDQQD